jgi:hypothetical protein
VNAGDVNGLNVLFTVKVSRLISFLVPRLAVGENMRSVHDGAQLLVIVKCVVAMGVGGIAQD